MKAWFTALRALIYSTGFIFLWGWLAFGVRQYDARLGIGVPAWAVPGGVVVILFGAVVCLACIGTFVVRGRGTPAPFDAPREFVALGPYRYVRNPMYLGGLGVMLGFGLYLRSFAILLLGAGFFLAAFIFVIVYEEPHLRSVFGATYKEYCGSVTRWIPRAPHSHAPPQR